MVRAFSELKILAADDIEDDRWALGQMLATASNLAFAESGEEALNALSRHDFDVLLLDIDLGDMSGFRVLAQAGGSGKPLPIVIMTTGHSVSGLLVQAIRSQVFDYLVKPFTKSDLHQSLQRACFFMAQKELQRAAVERDVGTRIAESLISGASKLLDEINPEPAF